MNLHSPLFVLLPVMLVPAIFAFNLHRKFLIDRRGSGVLLTFLVCLALAGLVFAIASAFSRYSLGVMVALASPILHALLLRRLFSVFEARYGREPIDVSFNWSTGLLKDRVLAIGFLLGSIGSSMIAVGFFHWGINVK